MRSSKTPWPPKRKKARARFPCCDRRRSASQGPAIVRKAGKAETRLLVAALPIDPARVEKTGSLVPQTHGRRSVGLCIPTMNRRDFLDPRHLAHTAGRMLGTL